MRAIVWTAYGSAEGLQLQDVPKPVPRAKELLVRVRATAVAAGDCELRALRFGVGMRFVVRLLMGPVHPRRKILGQEFAGVVEAVGARATRFRVGDEVYGTTGFRFGAYAEYLCVHEAARDSAVAIKPANMSFEEAATIPTGGLEALHFLRKAGRLEGRTILINGAAGGIGALAVQIAKFLGADVTGVDHPRKMDLMLRLGADRVIDYSREDFGTAVNAYDVILDVVGQADFSTCLGALNAGGSYLIANPHLAAWLRAPWAIGRDDKKVVVRGSPPRASDLDYLRRIIEAGRIRASIDRQYRLEDVPEAHRFVDSGSAVGRVVITP
ncbi:MAG TPA: NAD(P)-dependent alcohol dehydrogenase [Thermoplasmata archaeon]|nr:NAD(P)-dependent alcohol dehydrogenase [Thermoplasmata archaeon]